MLLKKILFFILFSLFIQVLPAQKKVILEKVWVRSIKGPEIFYLQNEAVKRTIVSELNTLLFKYYNAYLADTTHLNLEVLNELNKNQKSILYNSDGDTSSLRMFLGIFESTSQVFSSQMTMSPEDSILMNRAKAVFQLQIILLKKDRIVLKNTLDIIVSAGHSPGMGIVSNIASLTATGFTEMLQHGMKLLIDPSNIKKQIEWKAAPAFVADNHLLAKTMEQPRVYVSTTKDISAYTYHNKVELIRFRESVYEEIVMKGKKAVVLPEPIDRAIRHTERFSASHYVFLRQEFRDLKQNKDYLLKLLVQIDREYPYGRTGLLSNTPLGFNKARYLTKDGIVISPESTYDLFTNFLQGDIHYLFQEKDTVALFSIKKAVRDPAKKLYLTRITNGFDSSSFYSFDKNELARPYVNAYVVTGKINKLNFNIKCSGFGNTLKEIYLEDTLICIAQGKFTPERFVFFDASLSSEILNQLLMIAFNRFLE